MAKIKGMGALTKMLKDIRKTSEQAAQKGILKTAKLIEADAKASVPVKQGLLKNSIGVEQDQTKTFIFADARYAPYQEFGTGPLTEAPRGYEAYAAEFKITGEGHTPPKPFLFPAFFKHQNTIQPFIEEELNKVLGSSK